MTIDDVRQMYDEYCSNDEAHDCPYRDDREFERCEVCERSQQALDKMQYNAAQIIEFLLHEIDEWEREPDIRGWR